MGVKATISHYAGCIKKGKLYLPNIRTLETDPSNYALYYEITKQPDGEFIITFGPRGDGDKKLPYLEMTDSCLEIIKNYPDAIFYPVKSINGFTDYRSLFIDLRNQGY